MERLREKDARMHGEITVRAYTPSDFDAIGDIHDEARKKELELAGLQEAFLPFRIAAEREELFGYAGLFVAERGGEIAGFAACNERELAWLYVAPKHAGKGVGTRLAEVALQVFPAIDRVEVLYGNVPAQRLYEKLGFTVSETLTGQMPGNEKFGVTVSSMRRSLDR